MELLIGMTIGLVVAGAAAMLYVNATSKSTASIRMARLNQDLRSIMYLISNEVRRAGFVAITPGIDYDANGGFSVSDLACNPFHNDVTKLQIVPDSSGANSCVLFSYDLDKSGGVGCAGCSSGSAPPFYAGATVGCPWVLDSSNGVSVRESHLYDAGDNEMFGFRLNGSHTAVEARTSMTGAAAVTPGSASCDADKAGVWVPINNTNSLEITNLTFTLRQRILDYGLSDLSVAPPGVSVIKSLDDTSTPPEACPQHHQCQFIRTVVIELTGRAPGDTTVQGTVREEVRVRNDRYVNCQLSGGCAN